MKKNLSIALYSIALGSVTAFGSSGVATELKNVFHSIYLLDETGENHTQITVSNNQTSNLTLTLPEDAGSVGQVLATDGAGNLDWKPALTDPLMQAGDILYRDALNATSRLEKGVDGEVLTTVSGMPTWNQGLIGRTSGVAISSGTVGETVSAGLSPLTTITTTEADVSGASLTLSPGVWQIYYSVSMNSQTAASSGCQVFGGVVITDSSNTEIGGSYRSLYVVTRSNAVVDNISALATSTVVNISSSATYKLRAKRIDSGCTGAATITNSNQNKSSFFAVRIA